MDEQGRGRGTGTRGLSGGALLANGVTLRFVCAGHGDKALVLLHGWPQTSHAWRHVIPLLARHYRVVAPDLRGAGGSSVPAGGYDKDTLARDVRGLAQALGLRRVYAVGQGIGALVAYAYARQFPWETGGAAIVDMPIPGIQGWKQAADACEPWHPGLHPNLTDDAGGSQAGDVHAAAFQAFTDQITASPAAVTDIDLHAYADAYAAPERTRAGLEWYRTLSADARSNRARHGVLTVPLLLAFGEHGAAPLLDTVARGLRQAGARDVRPLVLQASGHWPAEEQPHQLAVALADFVDATN